MIQSLSPFFGGREVRFCPALFSVSQNQRPWVFEYCGQISHFLIPVKFVAGVGEMSGSMLPVRPIRPHY